MEFDIFTLLPLAVAIFVFWRLRQVLGTRNGNEAPPPFNPYDDKKDAADGAEAAEANDNVVTLPGSRTRRATDEAGTDAVAERIEAIAGKKSALKQGLTAIRSRDPNFDPDEFIDGAKIAYEMIVTGFADGDKRALKGLLSREVYDNFEAVIDERRERGEHVQASFVGIEKADIDSAELVKTEAQITMRFVSQMISATLNEAGDVVDGDLQEVAEIVDVWTFARPVKSRDPNWKLVATDA
ncbi:Tim44/TimA family putative adaptor protein [Pseudahrensia aquimaris]|uniref:Tim44/TimA family putative adaptor protein n=1 Tax=Pseudahrensia aquimaris TaxID=744461 RepID=A0ABW3FES6_9HYPH